MKKSIGSGFKLLSVSAAVFVAGVSTSVHAAKINCQFDTNGILVATIPWRNTLGPMADDVCARADVKRAQLKVTEEYSVPSQFDSRPVQNVQTSTQKPTPVQASMDAVPTGQKVVVITLPPNAPVKVAVPALPQPTPFSGPSVFETQKNDATVVQMMTRWGASVGYQVAVNGVFVGSSFPRHGVSFADIPTSKIGNIQPQISLTKAANQVVNAMRSAEFAGLAFEVVIDPGTKTLLISSKPV